MASAVSGEASEVMPPPGDDHYGFIGEGEGTTWVVMPAGWKMEVNGIEPDLVVTEVNAPSGGTMMRRRPATLSRVLNP